MTQLIKFGNNGIEVKIEKGSDGKEDIWLDIESIATLFDKEYSNIAKHINKIYKESEVDKNTFKSFYVITEKNGKTYKKEKKEYNLDVILSVGYKVNGKKGTEFRKWANEILGKYLKQGYVVNEKVMLDKGMNEVVGLLNNCQRTLKETKQGKNDEIDEVLDIIKKYGESFTSLQNYDSNNFKLSGTEKKVKYILNYDDAINYIEIFKKHLIEKGEASIMFGNEKTHGALDSILGSVFGFFFGNDVHEYLEEKASHLLYSIVKNHPFTDGNKRIGSFLFVTFLKKNDFLYKKDGTRKISEEALTFLTVMIAQSQPTERDSMVKMLINTIRGGK